MATKNTAQVLIRRKKSSHSAAMKSKEYLQKGASYMNNKLAEIEVNFLVIPASRWRRSTHCSL